MGYILAENNCGSELELIQVDFGQSGTKHSTFKNQTNWSVKFVQTIKVIKKTILNCHGDYKSMLCNG